jgi:hypothetical protein
MARLFGVMGVFLAAWAANVGSFASAQDAYLTRIETRPFYGATVTIEEGVRVFRPLPPTRQMIINPSQGPLHLSFTGDDRSGESGGGYASNNNGYAAETSSNYSDQSTAFYGDGGNIGAGGSARSDSSYTTKGKRLRGFPAHGVRVNGQHAFAYTSAADAQSQSAYQVRQKMAQHPSQRYPAHGFRYRADAAVPRHMPPMASGVSQNRQAYQQRRYAMPNVTVHRPIMRPPATIVVRSPIFMAQPSHRIGAATRMAPAHANQGHGGPAGRMGSGHMGMGMGGMGRGR